MKTVCKVDYCTGCRACVQKCVKHAILINDSTDALNAVINEDICINCGVCTNICPVNNNVVNFIKPFEWYQGWSIDESIRSNSASGGFATSIANHFIETGGFVCSCIFENGDFVYKVIDNKNDLSRIAGSKYVKSNTSNTYIEIQKLLKNDKKVLFIGLPCHVAGLLNFLDNKYSKNLYTIDLICHGTPSKNLLIRYLNDNNVDLKFSVNLKFRIKNKFRIFVNDNPVQNTKLLDSYMFTFLRGMNYTYNCYTCTYAGEDRISDITLGDSWGSDLDENEKKLGISLALCQTKKGKQLLEESNLNLFSVNKNIAKQNNKQLVSPMKKTNKRNIFFKYIKKNVSYSNAAYKADKIVGIRQFIKYILIKFRFL